MRARARRGELEEEGRKGGRGMMQCLATGVCARTRRGLRGWWEVRGAGRVSRGEEGGRGASCRHPTAPTVSTVAVLKLPSETSLYLIAFLRSSWSAHLAVTPILSPP